MSSQRVVATVRLVPLLALAVMALVTALQTGCSSGGPGDLYTDDAVDTGRELPSVGR